MSIFVFKVPLDILHDLKAPLAVVVYLLANCLREMIRPRRILSPKSLFKKI